MLSPDAGRTGPNVAGRIFLPVARRCSSWSVKLALGSRQVRLVPRPDQRPQLRAAATRVMGQQG